MPNANNHENQEASRAEAETNPPGGNSIPAGFADAISFAYPEFERAILSFQAKVGAPSPFLISDSAPADYTDEIFKAAIILRQVSTKLKACFKATKDQRHLRAELMIEELAEALEAMYDRDEVALLDGLADLMYVVVGTATQFKLPIESAFWEVHRSNMTKHRAAADHAGDKGKGPDYSPPNLKGVLDAYRSLQ